MEKPRVYVTAIGILNIYRQKSEKTGANSTKPFSRQHPEELLESYIGISSNGNNLKSSERIYPQLKNDVTSLSCVSAKLAIEDAKITDGTSIKDTECGIIFGSGCLHSALPNQNNVMPECLNNKVIEYRRFDNKVWTEVPPYWLVSNLIKAPAEQISYQNGIKGYCYNITNSIDNSSIAFGKAINALQDRRVNWVITGGSEGIIDAKSLFRLKKTGIACSNKKHSAPFNIGSDGAIVSSGSATLILENEYSESIAKKPFYAYLASHHFRYSPNYAGKTIDQVASDYSDLMCEALNRAKINQSSIAFIQANAMGIPKMDLAEATAIRDLFKDSVPVTSCSGSSGYTLGASGAMSIAFASFQLKHRVVLPIQKDDFLFHQNDLFYVFGKSLKVKKSNCLVNCFDFLGNMASLVLACE